MTPAMIAVSKTGPFGERKPPARSAAATVGGKRTRASAVAVLLVGVLSLTSTMAGCCSASRWVRVMKSTADVIHLDFLSRRIGTPQFLAQLAVAIGAAVPHAAHQLQNFRIARAGAQWRAQIEAVGREQASIEFPLRGQTRTASGAAKRLRHGRNESDFAGAVLKSPSLRHFALVVLPDRAHRPSRLDARGELARRHPHLGPPFVAIADVHEFDESHDHGRAAEAFDEIER